MKLETLNFLRIWHGKNRKQIERTKQIDDSYRIVRSGSYYSSDAASKVEIYIYLYD
jgi:hypothetical protein